MSTNLFGLSGGPIYTVLEWAYWPSSLAGSSGPRVLEPAAPEGGSPRGVYPGGGAAPNLTKILLLPKEYNGEVPGSKFRFAYGKVCSKRKLWRDITRTV